MTLLQYTTYARLPCLLRKHPNNKQICTECVRLNILTCCSKWQDNNRRQQYVRGTRKICATVDLLAIKVFINTSICSGVNHFSNNSEGFLRCCLTTHSALSIASPIQKIVYAFRFLSTMKTAICRFCCTTPIHVLSLRFSGKIEWHMNQPHNTPLQPNTSEQMKKCEKHSNNAEIITATEQHQ